MEAALRLPHADRVELIDHLLATLDPNELAEVDAAWKEEIQRRWREFEAGRMKTFSWAEVKDLVRKKFSGNG